MLSTELMKQQVIPLFLSPKGRISRGLFWKANLVLWLGFLILVSCVMIFKEVFKLDDGFQDNGFSFAFLLYFYVAIILTIKRLHDINWSGWLAVPCILTGILWLIAGFIAGTPGKNKHGDNPVEYEKNRLYINRETGLPPPPPPLDNPISKIVLYAIIISFLPSLAALGMVMPDKVEKPVQKQAEEVSSEQETVPVAEEPKKEVLPFDLQKGDEYQKIEAADGIDTYYIVTRANGTIEHYALDGTLQWSNVEHEEELDLDDIQSSQLEHNIQETNSTALGYLPFVGERNFNFLGGSGTGYIIKINPDGQTKIKSCGVDSCTMIYNGKYANPISFDDGSGFLFGNSKIYALPETGKLAEEGCLNYENDKCVSDLYSQ